MNREVFVFLVDRALVVLGFLLVAFFVGSLVISLKRDYVLIHKQPASMKKEPLAFWLVILSWTILAALVSAAVAQ